MIKKPGIIFSSDEHRKKIDRKGYKNSFFGKTHTDEVRAKMREVALNRNISHAPSISVEVTDLKTNKTTIFPSISKAAVSLGVKNHATISSRRLRKTITPYKGRYDIKFLPIHSSGES
jgi:hypothetical protein